MPDGVVFFPLKRLWTYPDGTVVKLYEEIKSGRKTSEWRDDKPSPKGFFFWRNRLLDEMGEKYLLYLDTIRDSFRPLEDLTLFLKVKKAWFTVGYPKNLLPHLEAEISALLYSLDSRQFEIQFENVIEVTE